MQPDTESCTAGHLNLYRNILCDTKFYTGILKSVQGILSFIRLILMMQQHMSIQGDTEKRADLGDHVVSC